MDWVCKKTDISPDKSQLSSSFSPWVLGRLLSSRSQSEASNQFSVSRMECSFCSLPHNFDCPTITKSAIVIPFSCYSNSFLLVATDLNSSDNYPAESFFTFGGAFKWKTIKSVVWVGILLVRKVFTSEWTQFSKSCSTMLSSFHFFREGLSEQVFWSQRFFDYKVCLVFFVALELWYFEIAKKFY